MRQSEFAAEAAALASILESTGGSGTDDLPDGARRRLLAFRSRLYELGVHDPVLSRFDSFTVPKATTTEIAEELRALSGF